MLPRVQSRRASIAGAILALAGGYGLWSPQARAEGALPNHSEELRLIESTERNLDPLGLDDATGTGLDEAARALRAKKLPDPVAESGDVLTAIRSVFESGHALKVRLEAGLAFVEETIELTNRGMHAADVAYRLRVPNDSVLWSLRVCVAARCREGARATTGELDAYWKRPLTRDSVAEDEPPSVAVSTIRDGRTRAFSLHVSAVRRRPVSVRVSYVTAAPLHGARARLTLPARGFDPRLVPSAIQVESADLADLSAQPAAQADPSLTIEIQGALGPSARGLSHRAQSVCGGAPCSREFRAAPAAPVRVRETWLVIDASPSMEGPARGRLPAVIAALLTRLPDATKVRAFAFAARAEELGSWPAIEAPLAVLGDAGSANLGAATHLSSMLTRYHDNLAHTRPRVIVISDGALDLSGREQAALERARHTGAELSLVALSDEEPKERVAQAFRRGGGLLHLTDLADGALSAGNLEALGEHLAVLLSPQAKSGVRAGEELVIERLPPVPKSGKDADDWLPRWLARDQPSLAYVAAGSARSPAIAAPSYLDRAPAAPLEATGLPKASVLDLLRTQLVPQARACLRSDRKGRADYAVGVTFRFLVARREVADVSIDGDVKGPLRECLFAILPRLHLPWFTGTLRVRYPIHTEREAEPPVIELAPELAHEVDRVISAPARRHVP